MIGHIYEYAGYIYLVVDDDVYRPSIMSDSHDIACVRWVNLTRNGEVSEFAKRHITRKNSTCKRLA